MTFNKQQRQSWEKKTHTDIMFQLRSAFSNNLGVRDYNVKKLCIIVLYGILIQAQESKHIIYWLIVCFFIYCLFNTTGWLYYRITDINTNSYTVYDDDDMDLELNFSFRYPMYRGR